MRQAPATGGRSLHLMGKLTKYLHFSLLRYAAWKRTVRNPLVFLCRFNNNGQSPVTSVQQAAGEVANGMKVGSGVGWCRSGEGDSTVRGGDKTSSGKQKILPV